MSTFPPIADYAFLSDCEVSTLIAPDGMRRVVLPPPPGLAEPVRRAARPVRRLVPVRPVARDGAGLSPVRAGHERARDDLAHADRLADRPATCSSWVRPTSPSGAPTTSASPAMPRPRGRCCASRRASAAEVEILVNCMPLFDYGRTIGSWSYDGRRLRPARGQLGRALDLRDGEQPRARGPRRPQLRAHDARARRVGLRLALVGGARPVDRRRGDEPARPDRGLLARVDEHGQTSPITSSGRTSSAARWRSRGSATRRRGRSWPRAPRRCPRPRAASGTGTTATPGSATPRSCCARCTCSASTGRRSSTSPSSSTRSAARARRRSAFELQIMYGIGGETDLTESTLDHLSGYGGAKPVRIGNGAYDQQQHDVWGMLLDSICEHQRNGGQIPVIGVGGHRGPRRHRDRAVPRAGPGHLGDARRAPALRRVEGHVLGRGGPGGAPGPAARRPRARRPLSSRPRTTSRPRCSRRACRTAGVFRQHYDTDDLDASLLLIPHHGIPPARRRPGAGDGARDRRRAHEGRPRPAVPRGDHRRRALGRGGHLHDLLVLARLARSRSSTRSSGPASCSSSCCRSPARCCSTRRRSTPRPASTWETSPRRSPTWRSSTPPCGSSRSRPIDDVERRRSGRDARVLIGTDGSDDAIAAATRGAPAARATGRRHRRLRGRRPPASRPRGSSRGSAAGSRAPRRSPAEQAAAEIVARSRPSAPCRRLDHRRDRRGPSRGRRPGARCSAGSPRSCPRTSWSWVPGAAARSAGP